MNGPKDREDIAGKPRAVGWETVHIFISSTFNDMHAERDYLIKEVFPELRDWCEERKLRLVDIDLRWGVTETDATRNKNVVQVCLDRIDKARPFFVCFLGQRYGWVPTDDEIAPETFRNFAGLGNAVERSASVTEMEVLHALLRDPFDRGAGTRLPAEHAFFYLRDPGYLAQVPSDPPALRRTYTDEAEPDSTSREFLLGKQADFRKTATEKTNRPARPYGGLWNPAARTPELALPLLCPSSDKKNRDRWRKQWQDWAGVATTDEAVVAEDEAKARSFNDLLCAGRLEDFGSEGRTLGAVILDDLKGAILARYPERKDLPEQDELEQEIDRHEDFVRTGTDVFIERTGDFAELDAYAAGNSRKLFVLVAKAGLGKSTLLANWVPRWRAREDKPGDETIHARFVGVGERSSTVDSLLRSILEELRRAEKLASEIPDNSNLLRSKFAELLGECGKKGRTVVVIDALNQLQSGLTDLDWLARDLPENVKLVVSFKLGEKQGDALAAQMRVDGRVTVCEVQPFTNLHHRRDLVAAYLRQYLKKLDEQHLEALIRADGAENPLFLKVVLTELRVFGAFARLGEMIKHEFGTTPQSAFDAVLRRLEDDPSYAAVPSRQAAPLLFGLLAHSRGGLPEDLLVRMFLDELGFGENRGDNMRAAIRLLLRQVRPFLARRDGRTDFFYEGFQFAARQRYASSFERKAEGQQRPMTVWRRLLVRLLGRGQESGRVAKCPPDISLCTRAEAVSASTSARALGPGEDSGAHSLKRQAENLRRPADQWHSQLANACERWATLNGAAKRYALRSLVHHEVEAGNATAAAEALAEFAYHHERLRRLGREDVADVTTDFALAYAACGIAPALRDRLALWKDFHAENAHVLKREDTPPQTLLLQFAVGHADASPVTRSAEEWLESTGSEVQWLRSLRRPAEVERSACLRTIEGHLGPVLSVGLLPDGLRAISASQDKTLKLWDLETGTCLRTFEGHTSFVNAVAVLPDGWRAISASQDKTLKLWDLETGACLRTLDGHISFVNAVAVLPDGRRAISASRDMTLKLWDLETGACLRTFKGHRKLVNAVAVLPDGRRAISASRDKNLKLWDLETGACLRTFEEHAEPVNAIAVLPNGRRAVSASGDTTIRLWDLESGDCLRMIESHTDNARALAALSDGRRAISTGDNDTLNLWDLETGACLRTFEGHTSFVNTVAVLPGGRRAISGAGRFSGNNSSIGTLSWGDNTLKLWDLEAEASLRTLEGHSSSVHALTALLDRPRVLSTSRDATVKLWDLETGVCLQTFEGHSSAVSVVKFLPNGHRAISGSWDHTLKLWDLETGACLRTFEGHTNTVDTVALLPDGSWTISAGDNGILKLWDLETGVCLRTFEGHTSAVSAVAFLPDGHRAISGSWDKTLKLWDLETGACLRTFEGHRGVVRVMALLPDGHRAISGSWDKTLKLWDLETGACLRTFEGHTMMVVDVAVLPDGRRAISAGGTLKLWDLDTGLCLATWQAAGEVTRCGVGFRVFVAGCGGGEVFFLKLMPSGPIMPETTAVAWHPWRPLLAVAHMNGRILLQAWDPGSQCFREVASAKCPGTPIEGLQWARNGALLCATARDGTTHVLDAKTLRATSPWFASFSAPRDISPDGLWRAVIRNGRVEILPSAPKRTQ